MNANELADELENRHQWKLLNHIHWSEQAATMLRQQQAEIEALKRHRNRLETLAEKMLQGSGEEDEQ